MRIRTKRFAASFAGLVMIGVLASTAISQDKKDKPAAGAGGAGGPDAVMMAEMMKASMPGEQHAMLKKMAGKFNGEVTVKPAADAPEMKSKGSEVSEMILDGRFLKTDFSGDMMGMPYKGLGLNGYDNMKKKYVSIWADSINTGVMTSEGEADASGKKITYGGEYPCPMEGGKIKQFRQVFTVIDDDHHEFEMFQAGPDGKEFRGLHIKYTRVK